MQLDGYRFKEPKCPSSKPITLFTVLHLQYSLTMTDSMGTKGEILVQSKESWRQNADLGGKNSNFELLSYTVLEG